MGWRAGMVSGTPQRSAQRSMSSRLWRALAGFIRRIGSSTWPAARNTPPSSMGRHTRPAPARAHSASTQVAARYANGHEKSK